MFAKCERGRATAVMKKQGLFVLLEVIFDILEQRVGKITIFSKKSTILEVDETNFSLTGDSFGFFRKGDIGVILFGQKIIFDTWSGGAKETIDFKSLSHKAGETKCMVAW